MDVKQTTFTGKHYLVWRKTIEMKNIGDKNMRDSAFKFVYAYIQKNNLTLQGAGSALYFTRDEESGTTDMAIGMPISEMVEITDSELSLVSVAEAKAVSVTVYGSYDQLQTAHKAIRDYLKANNLEATITVEEYNVTGMDTSLPSEWQTTIYYLLA